MDKKLLEVKNLTLSFHDRDEPVRVLEEVSFTLNAGEIVGIVGESGSGKSMTSLAIMGLLSPFARVDSGEILFEQKDLLKLPGQEFRKLKGSEISMVFQEPMTSLNPVIKIGRQVGEIMKIHRDFSEHQIKAAVIDALNSVGLSDALNIYNKYPHQLSGGMRQRVMIAMAALNRPKLLIADEPTTALDVTVQAEILKLLKHVKEQSGSSILFVSHDLAVVKEICERVIVMYEGRVVESGDTFQVLNHPQHEYTRRLTASAHGLRSELIKKHCLMQVNGLNAFYKEEQTIRKRHKSSNHVLKDISFEMFEGEILGIVGESGCGKSTLARTIAGLHKAFTGQINFSKEKPTMVFQDPYGSLNPAKRIGWILEEPLKVHGVKDRDKRRQIVEEMLIKVGLDPSYIRRFPRELSGGQRQRISIGCALINNSRFIIADEAVSALDVTVQSQILDLFVELHNQNDLSILFISHDLNIVRRLCHRVIVMYLGEVVEIADAQDIYQNPGHPYTKMLFESIIDNNEPLNREFDSDDSIEKYDNTSGCCFYHRCRERKAACLNASPKLEETGLKHYVRCLNTDE